MKNNEHDDSEINIFDTLYRLISCVEFGFCVWLCAYAVDHISEISWWKWCIIIPCVIGQICRTYLDLRYGLEERKEEENNGKED